MNHLDFLRGHYTEQPYEVSFETLALCNAACTFCPYPSLDRKGVKMNDGMIASLIDQMKDWQKGFYISPFKVNEPFLDPRLIRICRSINSHIPRAMIRLFTNGSPLTIGTLLEVDTLDNIAHLWVSLNSHDPAEYRGLMHLDFEKTAKRLDGLHALIIAGHFRHPVVVSKVSSGGDETPFQQYCGQRWPMFQVFLIKQDGWLGYVPPADPAIPKTACQRWFELSILATGEVALCCMDGKGEFPIGNIHEHSLLDIYNDARWKRHRALLTSRHEVYPCSTCTY